MQLSLSYSDCYREGAQLQWLDVRIVAGQLHRGQISTNASTFVSHCLAFPSDRLIVILIRSPNLNPFSGWHIHLGRLIKKGLLNLQYRHLLLYRITNGASLKNWLFWYRSSGSKSSGFKTLKLNPSFRRFLRQIGAIRTILFKYPFLSN